MSWLRLTANSACFTYPSIDIYKRFVHIYMLSIDIQLYQPYTVIPPLIGPDILGLWVTCGVKMMSIRHGWGWQQPQICGLINIIHIKSVWTHWYAVHSHTVAALNCYTSTTWLILWGSALIVELKGCRYVMVEADNHFKPLPASMLVIFKMLEHIDMLPIGIQQQPFP